MWGRHDGGAAAGDLQEPRAGWPRSRASWPLSTPPGAWLGSGQGAWGPPSQPGGPGLAGTCGGWPRPGPRPWPASAAREEPRRLLGAPPHQGPAQGGGCRLGHPQPCPGTAGRPLRLSSWGSLTSSSGPSAFRCFNPTSRGSGAPWAAQVKAAPLPRGWDGGDCGHRTHGGGGRAARGWRHEARPGLPPGPAPGCRGG